MTTLRPRVGVVGSCNVDLVVRCDELPRPGETVLGEDVVRLAGGKGANQACAAAALGASVTMVGSLGDDEMGRWLLSVLEQRGVAIDLMQRSPRATGTAFIAVDRRGENEIVVSPGANGDLDVSQIDLANFDVVLTQMEIPLRVVDDVARKSSSLILNAAPSRSVDPATLARCAVVIVNERECETLDLRSLEHCVVTLGERGAVHYQRGIEVARATAPTLDPVDAVGAGDVFCAAYALQYARGVTSDDALRFAVVAGALATMGFGAQGALPTQGEVETWLARA
ncbi:MAG: ribokinase [Acidimicrobiales bacterium]